MFYTWPKSLKEALLRGSLGVTITGLVFLLCASYAETAARLHGEEGSLYDLIYLIPLLCFSVFALLKVGKYGSSL